MKVNILWPFEYSAVEVTNLPLNDFVELVNEQIKHGWEPIGGISISERSQGEDGDIVRWSYAQAFRRPR